MSQFLAHAACYEVIPSIVKSGCEQTVRIIPREPSCGFDDALNYCVKVQPMEHSGSAITYILSGREEGYDKFTVKPVDGVISIRYTFYEEQQWMISVFPDDKPETEKKFYIYSLFEDLYDCQPFVGDLHIHSFRSDGLESPAIVAANYRKAGFDFMAITDHFTWEPSKEIIDRCRDIPTDLRLFYGEEVHLRGTYLHIVNFGGKVSVNEAYYNDPDGQHEKLVEEAKSLTVPEGVNAVEYAYRKWVTEKIHEGGGLSILAHPYWIDQNEYNMHTKMTEYVLKTGIADAYELLGADHVQQNSLQLAQYHDMCAQGLKIPIVGSTDCHGTEPPVKNFTHAKTIVFAQDASLDSLIGAIKNQFSTAVEYAPKDCPHVFGISRMVKYAYFLLQHYFPRHDELCVEEGVLLKSALGGSAEAKEALGRLQGRTDAYWRRFKGAND